MSKSFAFQLINILVHHHHHSSSGLDGAKWSSIIPRLYTKRPREPEYDDVVIDDHDYDDYFEW